MTVLNSARTLLSRNGNNQHAAEVERLLGRVFVALGSDESMRDEAQRRFTAALSIARAQSAGGLELRAATDLASLWLDRGQRDRAKQSLSDVYACFSEGFQTADLRQAKALLDDLTG